MTLRLGQDGALAIGLIEEIAPCPRAAATTLARFREKHRPDF